MPSAVKGHRAHQTHHPQSRSHFPGQRVTGMPVSGSGTAERCNVIRCGNSRGATGAGGAYTDLVDAEVTHAFACRVNHGASDSHPCRSHGRAPGGALEQRVASKFGGQASFFLVTCSETRREHLKRREEVLLPRRCLQVRRAPREPGACFHALPITCYLLRKAIPIPTGSQPNDPAHHLTGSSAHIFGRSCID